MSDVPFRLEDGYIPKVYDLHLTTTIKSKAFDGVLTLTLLKQYPSTYADLHAGPTLSILSITQSDISLTFAHIGDRLRIFGADLSLHPLCIRFTGSLAHPSLGFYWITDRFASTFFSPTYARDCFPCFDEPSFKAVFNITLTIPRFLSALSNMPEHSSTTSGGLLTVRFRPTPLVSTFLLAFAVGEFDYRGTRTPRGLPVDFYAPRGQGTSLSFALAEAAASVAFFERFLDFPYPLPRLQLAVIPAFASGGMEHFGLIFLSDACLVTSASAPVEDLHSAADIVAHEIAHQWLGDLVTPRFWDSLWLSEGFATFFAVLAVDAAHPAYRSWDRFLTLQIGPALNADACADARPLVTPVLSTPEIPALFDGIMYGKGAAVVRMLYDRLGARVFRAGMRAYVSEFAWRPPTSAARSRA
jgi:aminopeptidase N